MTFTPEQRKRWKKKHPDKVREERQRYKKAHPDKHRAAIAKSVANVRVTALSHYSNGLLVCANCGETHIEFLELDHINGGGKEHMRSINSSLPGWLKKNNYPEGFQVLCSNCNIKKVKVAAAVRGTTGTTSQKKYYRKSLSLRKNVFAQYMVGGKIQCACCGESDIDVLCMDHINGDGSEHRKTIGGKASGMYYWIKRNGYPDSFRILCHNCNQSLGSRGYCPHSKTVSA